MTRPASTLPSSSPPPSRRSFLATAGATGITAPFGVAIDTGRGYRVRHGLGPHRPFASDQLGIAGIGVGGKGTSDIAETAKNNAVVALCDVDGRELDRAKQKYPNATTHRDWREVVERADVDAITISTPDHMHCAIAMAAMQAGKHVYVQKPLTHSVFEARQLLLQARRSNVVTQMGNQHRSNAHMKGARYLLQSGAIGKVREAHVWTDRPIWPQGIDRPSGADAVPAELDWDRWLGVAPERPYRANVYHRFKWRGFWDFGTGALGDMGCHLMDPVVFALELPAPRHVWAVGPEPHEDTAPTWSIVTYEFPQRGYQPPLTLTWYDGKKRPDDAVLGFPAGRQVPSNGALFVGETGRLFVNHNRGPWILRDGTFADVTVTAVEAKNHYQEWANACKGEGTCISDFETAVPLTETVLLGNVAYRLGKRLTWDSTNLRCPGTPEADALIRREYRDGWDVAWV